MLLDPNCPSLMLDPRTTTTIPTSSANSDLPSGSQTVELFNAMPAMEDVEMADAALPMPTASTRCLVEINARCHVELASAQFLITYVEENNEFFLELLLDDNTSSWGERGSSVLQVLFRFPLDKPGAMEIFVSSYGRWRRKGKEFRHVSTTNGGTKEQVGKGGVSPAAQVCDCPSAAGTGHRRSDECWRLSVDVYEAFFEMIEAWVVQITLNGLKAESIQHRLPLLHTSAATATTLALAHRPFSLGA